MVENQSSYGYFHFLNFLPTKISKKYKENLNINVRNVFCTKIASKLTRTYSSKHGLKSESIQQISDTACKCKRKF